MGKEFPHAGSEPADIVLIQLCAAENSLRPAHLALAGIGFAFPFGLLQGIGLDEHALAFVLLACAAPFKHHGRKAGVFAGTTGQRGIARQQKDEVVRSAQDRQNALAFWGPGMG